MRPIRRSAIKRACKSPADEYAAVSGRAIPARVVKAQIYGAHKSAADAGRTASAPALPERTGAKAAQAQLVPHFAHISEAVIPPANGRHQK